jgi:hypothetical protein
MAYWCDCHSWVVFRNCSCPEVPTFGDADAAREEAHARRRARRPTGKVEAKLVHVYCRDCPRHSRYDSATDARRDGWLIRAKKGGVGLWMRCHNCRKTHAINKALFDLVATREGAE